MVSPRLYREQTLDVSAALRSTTSGIGIFLFDCKETDFLLSQIFVYEHLMKLCKSVEIVFWT